MTGLAIQTFCYGYCYIGCWTVKFRLFSLFYVVLQGPDFTLISSYYKTGLSMGYSWIAGSDSGVLVVSLLLSELLSSNSSFKVFRIGGFWMFSIGLTCIGFGLKLTRGIFLLDSLVSLFVISWILSSSTFQLFKRKIRLHISYLVLDFINQSGILSFES